MESKIQSRSTGTEDAVAILIADHKKVQKLCKEFETLKEAGKAAARAKIVEQVCMELTIHAQIEEEIFYPSVRKAIHDDDMMDEAQVEHNGAKELIAQLQSMEPGDDLYDAKFIVLGENVNHHIKEEQDEMFPKVRKAKLDLDALGKQLVQRKQELQEEVGLAPATGIAPRKSSATSSRKHSAA